MENARSLAQQMSKCAALSGAIVAATWGAAQPAFANDDAAIANLLRSSADHWNHGQLDDFMKSYERSQLTTYVSSNSVIRGYDAIRTHYASSYRGRHVGNLSISNVSVRSLGAAYAVVIARWRLAMHDGTRPSGIFSLVMHRGTSGWRIITDHSP